MGSNDIPVVSRTDEERHDGNDTVTEQTPVRTWTPDEVLQWFTSMNASDETKDVVVALALDGETLATVMTDELAHDTLRNELNVVSHIQRVKMINAMKNMINDEPRMMQNTPDRLNKMVGLREVKIPKLQGSHKDMTHEKWEIYTKPRG